MSDELVPNVVPTPEVGDQPEAEAKPKKRPYNKRRNQKPATPAEPKPNGVTNGTASAQPSNGFVVLTPAQLSKLWQAVTGGQIEVQGSEFLVSLDSFQKALPTLLERL